MCSPLAAFGGQLGSVGYMSHYFRGVIKLVMIVRSIVENAVRCRFDAHESGSIIVLSQFCPWKEHLFEIEKEEVCGVAELMLAN
jgi:uncharacterized UPF0160 family protein